ncbi:unnamed protein product [Chrysoparadoxa australica]
MLNKWVTFKEGYGKETERRPFLASDCSNIQAAEKWRREIIRETSKLVTKIQSAASGEHAIRDMNDQINKLLRERGHWEKRIRELGGPNYGSSAPKAYDADGRELPGSGGYKYFGAAKELPGVRELFQKTEDEKPRRTRKEMFEHVTPDYYGWRDEEDGVLVEKEADMEKKRIREAVQKWEADKRARGEVGKAAEDSEDEDVLAQVEAIGEGQGAEVAASSAATNAGVKAHVPVPNQQDIRQAILLKKKQGLLAKLASGDMTLSK